MHARTGRLQVSPEQIDHVVRVMTEDQIAMFHHQPGYRGFTGLADRERGAVMGISFWETEADMHAGDAFRARGAPPSRRGRWQQR